MLTINIRVYRVLFVLYLTLAVLFMGVIGSLLIPMISYELGRLWAAAVTVLMFGGMVALTLGLKKDLWNR